MLPPLLALLALAISGFKEPVTWPAPELSGPVRTFDVPVDGADWYGIPTTTDCVLRMPNRPVAGTVKLDGCRNIRLIGGEFRREADPCAAAQNGTKESAALVLSNWAGTAHVEGVKVRGRGFSDGMYATSTLPNSVVEVEASWFGRFAACNEPQSGYIGGWPAEHPDCFQTWAGPDVIRFDKVTCWTIYEGLNLDSNATANASGVRYPASRIDIRRTNVHLDERTPNGRQCYTAWSSFSPSPTHLEDAYCAIGNSGFSYTAPTVSADPSWWSGVKRGMRGGRDETSASEVGIGYPNIPAGKSPGTPAGGGPGPSPARESRKRPAVRASAARRPLRAALAKGARVRVFCPGACTIGVRATIARKVARRLRLRGTRVGIGHRRLGSRGWTKVVVRFRQRGRLRHAKRLRVRLDFGVRSDDRTLRTVRRLTLARRH
jgi:hypothetical protein